MTARRAAAPAGLPRGSVNAIAGVDLSLVASGLVALPVAWRGDWGRVASAVVGHPLPQSAGVAERARRTTTIATALVAFCGEHGVTRAWLEQPAFGVRTGQQHALGELAGVVKVALLAAGVSVEVAPLASARKLLLGRLPRAGVKAAVRTALLAAGAPAHWTLDVSDAFTVANWALAELGGWCLMQEPSADSKTQGG